MWKRKLDKIEKVNMGGPVKCFNGHTVMVDKYDSNTRCDVCHERLYPSFWFESSKACANVRTLSSVEVEVVEQAVGMEVIDPLLGPCIVKRIPYLSDAVVLVPKKIWEKQGEKD